MKTFFLLVMFFGSHLFGQAQVLEKRIQKFAAEKNIDSFLVYNYACNYCIIDDCSWEEPHYLFWKQSGAWYVKRFDYCQTFQTLQLDSLNALTFYLQHHNEMNKEQIKQPNNKKISKRMDRKDAPRSASAARFTCLHYFNFHAKGQLNKILADAHDLNSVEYLNVQENDHYTYNQKTQLKRLIEITELMIKQFNAENRFIAE
jgi:hypothetical protein